MTISMRIMQRITSYIAFYAPLCFKTSYYAIINNTVVWLSDHCMKTSELEELLSKRPFIRSKAIISIVFDFHGNTYNKEECLTPKSESSDFIAVEEYVCNMHSDKQYFKLQDIANIIYDIERISRGEFRNYDRTKWICYKREAIGIL